MLKPVNNQALIEVVSEYGNLTASGQDEQVGILREVSFSPLHLTASTGLILDLNSKPVQAVAVQVQSWIGKTVRYALFADSDSTQFPIDGKPHVLIPWYRILGVEDGK